MSRQPSPLVPRVIGSLLAVMALGLSCQVTSAAAQTGAGGMQQELAAMRQELARLRAEVDALKAQVGAKAPAAPGAEATQAAPASVSMLQTQVQDLAQVKVESASRLPVKLFGTIVSNTFFNNDEANWLENPNLVNRFAGVNGKRGSFSSTLRQSRIGVSVDGAKVGENTRASGTLVMDFFGGAPAFKTGQVMGLPRLLVAFARLESDRTALEVGQDHMMLAPRDPTSIAALSFPDLFRSGNLYLRVPQARVERKVGGAVTVMGGIVAPIAGDFSEDFYTFVPPALSGERSRMPAFQGRLVAQSGNEDEGREVAFGVSGHFGRERNGTTLDDSWAAAVDFNAQGSRFGVAGEFFTGENIDQFGGSLGQEAKSTGGWAEARVKLTTRLSINGGFGFDKLPDNDDTLVFVPRRENRSVFSNVIFKLTPEVATSVEYKWLSTLFQADERHENHHINWVFSYSF